MHPFFRPRRALASAPEQTPYQRAGQVWDDRMGLSLAHARNWRRIALANLVLAGFLGAGWWVQADRAVVKPFVVEVSDWGETQRITAIGGRSPGTIAAEGRTARADFHRAASRPATAAGSNPRGRSAALQAFFVANAGRGLLPSGETSGVLSPNLKTEES